MAFSFNFPDPANPAEDNKTSKYFIHNKKVYSCVQSSYSYRTNMDMCLKFIYPQRVSRCVTITCIRKLIVQSCAYEQICKVSPENISIIAVAPISFGLTAFSDLVDLQSHIHLILKVIHVWHILFYFLFCKLTAICRDNDQTILNMNKIKIKQNKN